VLTVIVTAAVYWGFGS